MFTFAVLNLKINTFILP